MFLKCCFGTSNKLGSCRICTYTLKNEYKCNNCDTLQSLIEMRNVCNFSDMLTFTSLSKMTMDINTCMSGSTVYDYLLLVHHIVYNPPVSLNHIPRVLTLFGDMPEDYQVDLTIPTVYMTDYVQFMVKYINQLSCRKKKSNWELRGAVKSLDILHKANSNYMGNKLPPSSFICTLLDLYLDIKGDYKNYKKRQFNLLSYPFLLPTSIKFKFLELETDRHRKIKFYHLNYLCIRREMLIFDSRVEVEKNKINRKLRIEFENEEGLDAGGLVREWSTLVCDYLTPFCIQGDWISEDASETDMHLMGTIFGLAIFNGTVLNTNFPLQFFKLLLGIPLSDYEFEELFPDQARSLKKVKEASESAFFDETFGMLTFCRNYKKCGPHDDHRSCKEFIKHGHQTYLSHKNVDLYIRKYKESLLYSMNKPAFDAFKKAFWDLLPEDKFVNDLFSPLELYKIIQGDVKCDLTPLRDICVFDYSAYQLPNPVPKYSIPHFINDFWQILLHELTLEEKRKFLRFTTGSDRLSSLRFSNVRQYDRRGFYFKICISSPDSEVLPVAHTCITY